MCAWRRARTEEQKQERRQKLLDATWRLLQKSDFEDISVAAVAREAGLAKGTVYLYFKTREELFLAVQAGQIVAWLDALDSQLDSLQGSDDIPAVAGAVCHSLCRRPALAGLLGKLHVILEQNAGYEAVRDFKHMLSTRLFKTGALLEACLPFLAPGMGVRLGLWYYALIIGLEQLTNPTPVVKQVIAGEPDMGVFAIDFTGECRAAMVALLNGLKTSTYHDKIY